MVATLAEAAVVVAQRTARLIISAADAIDRRPLSAFVSEALGPIFAVVQRGRTLA
jgi:hypothetical protein